MNSHNITNESLALALMLVVVAILISHKEKLALEKDILQRQQWANVFFRRKRGK